MEVGHEFTGHCTYVLLECKYNSVNILHVLIYCNVLLGPKRLSS